MLDAAGSQMNVLRMLFSTEPVERNFITRDELASRLLADLEEGRDDIRETQDLYRVLGIIGQDVDFYELLLGLYTETVLGFFDTEEEKLFIVQETSEFGALDLLTFAHEFAHGLQQQHFDIHSTGEALEEDSDRSRAFRALVEGDAQLSETLFMFNYMDPEQQAEAQQAMAGFDLSAFRSAPYVIRRTFVFPYREGAQFVVSLFQSDGWDAVNQAFDVLPQSTEHILHPEKYLAGEAPVAVEVPDLSPVLGEGWTQTSLDTMGEFLLMSYLETDVAPDQAFLAAEGWGGDIYSLLKGPNDESVLVLRIAWDTERDADEFFEIFLRFMQARTGIDWAAVDDEGIKQQIDLPGQSVFMSLDLQETLVIFAPDPDIIETVATALGIDVGGGARPTDSSSSADDEEEQP